MASDDELEGAVGGLSIENRSKSTSNVDTTSMAAVTTAAVTAAAKVINNNIPFPEPLCLSGNVRQNVEDFIEGFEIYLVATGLEHRDERVKIATLKAAMGVTVRKIFNNWPLRETEKSNVSACLQSLRKYIVPKRNVKLARYEFIQCKQMSPDEASEGETVMQFINRARALVKDCNYGNIEEEMLRDVIVAGLQDHHLQKEFIDKPDLPAAEVMAGVCLPRQHKMNSEKSSVCKKKRDDAEKFRKPAKNSKPRKKVQRIDENRSEKSYAEEEESLEEEVIDSIEYLYSVKEERSGLLKAELIFKREGMKTTPVKCILDTGATCNVVELPSLLDFLNVSHIKLDQHRSVLKGFGGNAIKTLGRATVDVIYKGKEYKAVFNVVKFPQIPILSLYTCKKLNLVNFCLSIIEEQEGIARNILSRYSDVFEGIGQLAGDVHLNIDSSIKPVVQPARRIPITLQPELKKQLDQLEEHHIINRVVEPTDWVTLDEESSRLTTFWTPYGRYRWLRMPFGISPAPEIFQHKLQEAVDGLKGVRALADDVIIFGCGDTMKEAYSDHNKNLQSFLLRMRDKNVKLNKNKIRLCQTSVKFFGHILTSEGVKADPDKIRSIVEMEQPHDAAALLRFLGMITYLSNYMPKLSTVAEPLRKLATQKQSWIWENVHQEAFVTLKTMVTEAPVLKYFDINKDAVIQCDSSSVGLGAVLMQDGKPVSYASKTLTQTERRYAQIEKETLAIVYACRKFEMYIIGKEVTVQTDHLPLLKIFQKPLCEAPMRLQRMLLALQRYKLKLQFKPGKEIVIADMLSRAAMTDGDPTDRGIYDIYTIDMDFTFAEFEQINVLDYIPISDFRLDHIRKESSNDADIQHIIRYIVEGWPARMIDVPEKLKVYWKYKDELSTQNGLVYRNNRILIPIKIRKEILERLHASHSGIQSTMKLARDAARILRVMDPQCM
ncbi:uncharacterized protein LOC128736007 [Sabethes cyaneus]|uniref:uncharacterized protein LOC128736007 n=1 Tax=Sabethes cyaneus TaxID=53552 RepID=UPI00237D99AC|nr:uncharacterized protein LOC128736007 [Sabethes cyaneus]